MGIAPFLCKNFFHNALLGRFLVHCVCYNKIERGEKMEKKALIVLTLRILETESDADNPLTQIQIAETISKKFPCDRKTVGRNIKFLREIGYPIVKCGKGFYMDNMQFSRAEIAFVLTAVRSAPKVAVPAIDQEELSNRLFEVLSRYYKRSKNTTSK